MPRLALLLALLPTGLAALPWDGTYRPPGGPCTQAAVGGGAIRIEGGVLDGVGARCAMTLPVDVLDMDATLYTMECEGEGQRWTERAMLMRAAEGDAILLVWNGYAFRYERCPGATEGPAGAPPEVAAG